MPTITHTFVSSIADDAAAVAAGEVVPSNWNANHTLAYSGSIKNSGSSATMAATADVLEINVSGAFTVNLPTSPVNYKPYSVVDGSSGAATITISTVSIIVPANGAWTGYYNGSAWRQTA